MPLQQNIDETSAVVELAHAADISCEGEIGFVGYAEGESSAGTDPAEAAEFAQATGIDAMAISVGNVHLQQTESAGLDVEKVRAIEAISHVPLVIHGGSGVPALQRRELAKTTSICKFNVGTELRMAFGSALRQSVAADETRFDRNAILKDTLRRPAKCCSQCVKPSTCECRTRVASVWRGSRIGFYVAAEWHQ
jgi:fructose-bisphosphate aldolase class II